MVRPSWAASLVVAGACLPRAPGCTAATDKVRRLAHHSCMRPTKHPTAREQPTPHQQCHKAGGPAAAQPEAAQHYSQHQCLQGGLSRGMFKGGFKDG